MRKINFFYYIFISNIILILAFINTDLILNRLLIFMIMAFLGIALKDHFYEIKDLVKKGSITRENFNLENIKILIGCPLAAVISWYINHELAYGPMIASGIIGVIAALLFSPKEAGAYYIASFIGMSSQFVVPSMFISGIIGLLAGFIIIFSQEVYAGIGGKGGTIAAFSTQLVRVILSFFL